MATDYIIPNTSHRASSVIYWTKMNPGIPRNVYIDIDLHIRTFEENSEREAYFRKHFKSYFVGSYDERSSIEHIKDDIEFVAQEIVSKFGKRRKTA